MMVEEIWYSHSSSRLEHHWAGQLMSCEELQVIGGFGSSDCQYKGHLFYGTSFPQQGTVCPETIRWRPRAQ
jgi:Uri superfamily endonuclease